MAYNELIKNFNRIRDYMREFYIYGFKCREEYTKKSARSYDDEKRRMESLLGDYMRFRQTPEGKNVFISIDSRVSGHNPLYKAWKAKSFTDGDITLHFLLLDILKSAEQGICLTDIVENLYEMSSEMKVFDESTVRKKLKEYTEEGIVTVEKKGKNVFYLLGKITDCNGYTDFLDFFSEIAPCGVVGSFLLDKTEAHDSPFSFKHHYITSALDSEIVCEIFQAMRQKKSITIEMRNRSLDEITESHVVPLRIMQSVQTGRQYLATYVPCGKRITFIRTDEILTVKAEEVCEKFDFYRARLDRIRSHMWGVSSQGRSGKYSEHVDFTVTYGEGEQHIPRRLEREKRIGKVEHLDGHTSRFSADVYDASELIPWIRTFICRICEIHFSNESLQKQFCADLEAMYRLYDGKGGD